MRWTALELVYEVAKFTVDKGIKMMLWACKKMREYLEKGA